MGAKKATKLHQEEPEKSVLLNNKKDYKCNYLCLNI